MRPGVMTAMDFTGYRHSEDSVKLDIDTFYRRGTRYASQKTGPKIGKLRGANALRGPGAGRKPSLKARQDAANPAVVGTTSPLPYFE